MEKFDSYPSLLYGHIRDIRSIEFLKGVNINLYLDLNTFELFIKKYRTRDHHYVWFKKLCNLIRQIRNIRGDQIEFVQTFFSEKLSKNLDSCQVPTSNYWDCLLLCMINLHKVYYELFLHCISLFELLTATMKTGHIRARCALGITFTSIIGTFCKTVLEFFENNYGKIFEIRESLPKSKTSWLSVENSLPTVINSLSALYKERVEMKNFQSIPITTESDIVIVNEESQWKPIQTIESTNVAEPSSRKRKRKFKVLAATENVSTLVDNVPDFDVGVSKKQKKKMKQEMNSKIKKEEKQFLKNNKKRKIGESALNFLS